MTTTTASADHGARPARDLTVTLPSDTEIMMTRVFDAPRELVFKAHSSCEHVRQWWGPRGHTMPECEMDFRPGGKWRFVNVDEEGNRYVFFGEYRDIVEPERIDWTFGFEGMPGDPGPESMTLEEHDGQTLLVARSFHGSKEERDAVLQSGIETGAAETWDRLAEYLATLA